MRIGDLMVTTAYIAGHSMQLLTNYSCCFRVANQNPTIQASFDGLRACIPELEHNDKSPKVTILQGASDFIAKLKQRQTDLVSSKDNLSTENTRLMIKLRQLQAQLSAISA